MLQIQNIKKQYITGELVQTALNGVTLTLRDNEFVAILGPSGSGKTTLLNVIGGLDRYDSGDLIINGISTKKYSDRDWDSYRNHTIGFVFQSYNLIPHQTVLANVELALTISGISRSERKKRAAKALTDVGLGDQLHKRPNQMSGGQMQRVAIARALVNNPDILLADEPTGALDSETSIQVMELLKEVSKDRLVVMVTHNPELAEQYANRVVRVKDGKIIDDSNPYATEQLETAVQHKNMGRASMSFWTALSLSFNNLRTKKGRTLLTSFAGSIGIIGIALIMSLSTGFQNYIDKIQEDTLSSYPLTIQSETADMTALMSAYGSMLAADDTIEEGTVQEQQMLSQMFAKVGTNDLASFKKHMDENMDEIEDDINILKYSYGVKPLIYSADTSDGIKQVNPGVLFGQITGMSMMSTFMDSDVFYEMINKPDLLAEQYDVLRGKWPESAEEMVVVLQTPDQITDYMAYTLGLKEVDGLLEMIKKVMEGQEAEDPGEPMLWSYDDLMALEFVLVPVSEKYQFNAEYEVWEDMSQDTVFMQEKIAGGKPLRVVGIVCPKEGVSTTLLTPGVAYTQALTDIVIEDAAASDIVRRQLESPDINVFTGKEFGDAEKSELDFEDMISIDGEKITSAFGMDVNTQGILNVLKKQFAAAVKSVHIEAEPAERDYLETFELLARDMLSTYVTQNADPVSGEAIIELEDTCTIVSGYLASDGAKSILRTLARKYEITMDTAVQLYEPALLGMLTAYIASEPTIPDLPEIPEVPGLPEMPDIPELPEAPTTAPLEPTEATNPADDQTAAIETTMPLEGTEAAEIEVPEQQGEAQATLPTNAETVPDVTPPDVENSGVVTVYATIQAEDIDLVVSGYKAMDVMKQISKAAALTMMRAEIIDEIEGVFGSVVRATMRYVASSFYVDEEMLASAFSFNMNEAELRRLMEAMTGTEEESSFAGNLRLLGYADKEKPTAIAIYFTDFEAKSNFLAFLDRYNEDMQAQDLEDHVIRYTDITNIMMSSVRTIIDSVSYVLIAFVAVSLIVSSIMIGIITYISVMERTKEIGILRAIGASKSNISQVFNAETFIIGLCAGLIGVGMTLLLNIPINIILKQLTNNLDIRAQLPAFNAVVLVILSMLLTLIGGLIPSKHAARKDPVIALRSE